MKKVFFALVALFALTFTACSTDEDTSTKEQAIQTTSVLLDVQSGSSSASTTGKQINNADKKIPVAVKTITIKAVNAVANVTVQDNWDVVLQGGDNFIKLNGVAIGSNKFTISTTTDSPQVKELTNFTSNESTSTKRFDAALANISTQNPYALYNGEVTENILATDLNSVRANMTTKHGRILSIFQLSNELKDPSGSKDNQGWQAKITATVDGVLLGSAITKRNELVTFKWSNEASLAGKKVTYKIEIASINDQNDVRYSRTIEQVVLASTSLSCYYEIDKSKDSLTKREVGIELSWQEWINAHCTDCNI